MCGHCDGQKWRDTYLGIYVHKYKYTEVLIVIKSFKTLLTNLLVLVEICSDKVFKYPIEYICHPPVDSTTKGLILAT
jgi:hypothetical protein